MIGVILRRPINHESGGHVRLTKSVLFFNMLACLSVCTIKQPSPFPASTRCTKTKGNIKPMECIDCVSMAHRHKHHESVDGRRIFVFVLFFCLCVLTTTKPTKRHTSVSFCKVLFPNRSLLLRVLMEVQRIVTKHTQSVKRPALPAGPE